MSKVLETIVINQFLDYLDDDVSVCISDSIKYEHVYLTEASPFGTGVYKIVITFQRVKLDI